MSKEEEIINGNYPFRAHKFPFFYCWANPQPVGKSWAFGWLTGIDSDLICVFPNVTPRVQEHYTLSPACSNRLLAFIAFVVKRLLFILDPDLQYRREEQDGK